MRVVVLGYHNVGCACLRVLLDEGEDVAAVYTHGDDPREEIWFESVGSIAVSRGIPVHHPAEINEPLHVERIRRYEPDIIFSFYYRKLVSREILEIPRLGALNMHGSYLPHYRGRCPVNWVLVNGETQTGVTLHHMVERADAGEIVAQQRIAIDPEDTARSLHDKITTSAAKLLKDVLPALRQSRHPGAPQDLSAGSCFRGRRPEDGRIDWRRSAHEVHNLVRAVTHPFPGAFTSFNGQKLFVWESRVEKGTVAGPPVPGLLHCNRWLHVETGSGLLRILRCQLEGQPEMGSTRFMRSQPLHPRVVLGGAAS